MDVHCARCSEPWDVLTVTEAKREQYPEFEFEVMKITRCPSCPTGKVRLSLRALAREIAANLLPDDDPCKISDEAREAWSVAQIFPQDFGDPPENAIFPWAGSPKVGDKPMSTGDSEMDKVLMGESLSVSSLPSWFENLVGLKKEVIKIREAYDAGDVLGVADVGRLLDYIKVLEAFAAIETESGVTTGAKTKKH